MTEILTTICLILVSVILYLGIEVWDLRKTVATKDSCTRNIIKINHEFCLDIFKRHASCLDELKEQTNKLIGKQEAIIKQLIKLENENSSRLS